MKLLLLLFIALSAAGQTTNTLQAPDKYTLVPGWYDRTAEVKPGDIMVLLETNFTAITTNYYRTLAGDAPIAPVTLEWDCGTTSADTRFYLFHSLTLKEPLTNWVCLTNVAGTDRSLKTDVIRGQNFFYLCASNWWGMSDPSNVAETPAVPVTASLRIRRD